MIPAKNRERKCATCKHYQPSPLWRKGWCRNPLLYDRNTNHLVEAESLSCNRTFIDYWEPGDGSTAAGPAPRSSKPKISPAISMETVDAEGNRGLASGNTPATGMPRASGRSFLRSTTERPRAPLSLVTTDTDESVPPRVERNQARTTRQIPKIDYPEDDEFDQPANQARNQTTHTQNRVERQPAGRAVPSFPRLSSIPLPNSLAGPRLWIALAAIAALVLLGGGFLLTRPNNNPVAVAPTKTATTAAPSPTGFGDPTATSNLPPTATVASEGTAALPPSNIAIGGWVQVNSSNGLRIRQEPGTDGTILFRLPSGFKAHVVDGPKQIDGSTWWKVDHYDAKNPTASGWCAADFLVPTTAPTATVP